MALTFECGTCHSTYRLDEHQITPGGVKITCPRCLSFFFLKKEAVNPKEEPVIEHLVKDGAYELRVPPPAPHEITADQLLSDDDLRSAPRPKSEAPVSLPRVIPPPEVHDTVRPTPEGLFEDTTTKILVTELSDFPSDRPPEGWFDRNLIPISAFLLTFVAVLFLNFFRLVPVPGLNALRAPLPTPVPTAAAEDPTKSPPKYGFPILNDPAAPSSR